MVRTTLFHFTYALIKALLACLLSGVPVLFRFHLLVLFGFGISLYFVASTNKTHTNALASSLWSHRSLFLYCIFFFHCLFFFALVVSFSTTLPIVPQLKLIVRVLL